MIENMLNYSPETVNLHLDTVIFELDTVNQFDNFNQNTGMQKRGLLFKHEEEIELIGRLHCDVFNCNKLLLNGISFQLTLELNDPKFYLFKKTATNTSELKIIDCNLFMDHVKVLPDVALSIERHLENKMAIYPYKRVDVKTFSLTNGATSFSLDNIYNGNSLPETLIFTMVKTSSYNGNPFNFQHFNLKEFNASINGYELSPRNLKFDFSQSNPLSQRAYFQLFKQLHFHRFDRANLITRELFNNNCFMLGYDLTPDRSGGVENSSILSGGNIRLQGLFSEALKEPITIIVYMQFDSEIAIDKGRNVYIQE